MEWYQELEEKYIQLFEVNSETKKPIRGIEVGEGWAKHVENFLETLEWHRTHNKQENKENKIKIFQIKEKFGEVRAYLSAPDHINDMIEGAIGRLEGKCSITCESCGKLEYNCIERINGWIVCLCQECMEKNKRK